MSLTAFLLYIAAFVILALSSRLIVTTIRRFTQRIRVQPFVFSFFAVGMLTSVGEIAVAINALTTHQPEIFVGSLLGGTLVIFAVIVPVAIISARGIAIYKHIKPHLLLPVLVITAAPAIVAVDQKVSVYEACALVVLYLCLFVLIRAPRGTFQRAERLFERERKSLRENTLLRLALGGVLVFFASRYIVDQTVVYANYFHVSAFLVSVVVVAIGMNLPELTLALRARAQRDQKTVGIAIGDLMGSAAANVVIFGVFSLLAGGDIVTTKNFLIPLLFIVLTLGGFFLLTLKKGFVTPLRSIVLIVLYCAFLVAAFVTR